MQWLKWPRTNGIIGGDLLVSNKIVYDFFTIDSNEVAYNHQCLMKMQVYCDGIEIW